MPDGSPPPLDAAEIARLELLIWQGTGAASVGQITEEQEDAITKLADLARALLARVDDLERERDEWRDRAMGSENIDVPLAREDERFAIERAEAAEERLLAAQQALRELTSYPLTWHPRSEAEQKSFDATLRAYKLALAAVGRVPAQEDSE